jgi:hypothetical protein
MSFKRLPWFKRNITAEGKKLLKLNSATIVGVYHILEMLAAECGDDGRILYGGEPPELSFLCARTGLGQRDLSAALARLKDELGLVGESYRILGWKERKADYQKRKEMGDMPILTTDKIKQLSDNYPINIDRMALLEIDIDIDRDKEREVEVLNAFLNFRSKIQQNARATPRYLQAIHKCLKARPAKEIETAIDNFSKSSFWMGQHRYNGICWFFSPVLIDRLNNPQPDRSKTTAYSKPKGRPNRETVENVMLTCSKCETTGQFEVRPGDKPPKCKCGGVYQL